MKRYSAYLALVFIAAVTSAAAQQQPPSQVPVKDGANAVYLFYSNESLNTHTKGMASGGLVSRSIDGGGFKELGRLARAATPEAFRRAAGDDALKAIASLKHLRDEGEAWQYLETHPQLSDYGILAADIRFLEAMGACYADREIKKMHGISSVFYRLELQLYGEVNSAVAEGRLILNQAPGIDKPVLTDVKERDSSLSVTWKSPAASSPDAMFGEVYRKKGNYGKFELAGKTFANQDGDGRSITYSWHEKAEPGNQYYFVVVPTTLTGLRGPASDTASAISANFGQLTQSGLMTVKDSAGGILLQWKPVEQKNFFSGLVIERSKDPKTGYSVIDTLDVNQGSYLDLRILPNIQYHYRIRMLTIRQNILEPSAFGSAVHKGSSSKPESPENARADGRQEGIRITWNASDRPDISGYYVFRQHPDSTVWEPVSNLVRDTIYTDSTVHNGRIQYHYAVSAVNRDDVKSDLSNIAVAAVKAGYAPPEPYGLQAAADGNRVLLRWREERAADGFLAGYNVYRKKGKTPENFSATVQELKRNSFEKLNPLPMPGAFFTDKDVVSGNGYVYLVTAVDVAGSESNGSLPATLELPEAPLLPVAELRLHRTSAGIVVEWDAPLQQGITGFALYRRPAENPAAEKLASLAPGINSFTDSAARKGKLYFYSLRVIRGNKESAPCGEKGARW